MVTNSDSYDEMLEAVRMFHEKHRFKENGGEDLLYRIALMTEELGEIAECVTKGKSKDKLAEEVADLLILLLGTAIAADFDLRRAFWEKMQKIQSREGRLVNGRIRVSEFKEQQFADRL